jgi:UDP-glucose 4-epimerase
MMRPTTVLVTGAAGLIGSAVVRALDARGLGVIAVDDFSIGDSRPEGDRIVWERLDVADDALAERLAPHAPDLVVHGAAHPGGRSLEEPSNDVRVNALGSMRVFEWCARRSVPVVYLSSSAVYGEQPPVPIPETAPVAPATIYAVCKIACERFLRVLEAGYGLPWTVLRLFATYGAGHRPSVHQGIVNVMLTQLLAGDTVLVRGSLERVRDLVAVEDAARAIVECALEPATRGHVLNVGTGTGVTIRELIGALCRALGRREDRLEIREKDATVGDPRYSVADVRRLHALTGFAAARSLRDGLDELVRARVAASGAR